MVRRMTAQEEQTAQAPRGLLARLAPSHRDGLALVLSSALTSGVGLLYWVVAARLFDPVTLGVNSVALSTMMLLASAAHLNMTYALLRFVPVAGLSARRLVLGGYTAGAALAALAGTVFALGAPIWAPDLVAVAGHGPLVLFFALATPISAIFVMQDYVLTGSGRATLVPTENLIFSLLKLALLACAAVLVIPGGIAVSWVASTAVVVVALNVWLLLRALPQFGRRTQDRAVPITLGAIARFVRADYAGAVFWQVAMFGLPVIVLARLDAGSAAAYGVVWTIAQSLYLVSSGMGQSMVAHGAADPGRVDEARRAVVRRSLRLVVPAAVVVALGAPLVLSIFGEHYAESGGWALALAALSAIPNVVTASTVSAARVRQRMGVLFGVPATVTVIVVTLSWLLMPALGITAVGLSWLVAQLLVAGGILLTTAPWLPPPIGTRIDAARSAMLLRRIGAAPFVGTGIADAETWGLRERLSGGSTSVVVEVGPEHGPGALLKAADTARGQIELRWQTEVLNRLHADSRVRHWSVLVPRVLTAGDAGGSYYAVESRIAGEGSAAALLDPARRRTLASSAIATISELHRCTSAVAPVGEGDLQRWVHARMAAVVARLPKSLHASARRLEDVLTDGLRGRSLAVGWTHGDYGPGNILADPDGRVVGVVDWCNADPRGLPALDVMGFLVLSSVVADGEELGDLVIRWISQTPPPAHDVLARSQRMLGGMLVDENVLCVLAWLQHVSQSLVKSPQYGANPVWVRRNLRSVVERAPALLDRPRLVAPLPSFPTPMRPEAPRRPAPVGAPSPRPRPRP
jgi:O-antigen/teichoic acid export membrane protein/aminoglycoside phosphotransferase